MANPAPLPSALSERLPDVDLLPDAAPVSVPGAGSTPPPAPEAEPAPTPPWSLPLLAGRLVEITGTQTPRLSLAVRTVVDAQMDAQPAAWIAVGGTSFHPPDAAAAGVDLAALPVIDTPDASAAARAADHLLRSGAFGLVVVDLPAGAGFTLPAQARLAGLARHHRAVLLCLTRDAKKTAWPRAHAGALGSLVSLRAEGEIVRRGDGLFDCRVTASKDKRRGPGWTHEEIRRGPDGLR